MKYDLNEKFAIDTHAVGFALTVDHVLYSATASNFVMKSVGEVFLKRLTTATISTCVGDIYQSHLISATGAMANQYRNGRPDTLPIIAAQAPPTLSKDYPVGVEIKTSAGSVGEGGVLWPYGKARLDSMQTIPLSSGGKSAPRTPIMAVLWDFIDSYPVVTAVFCRQLSPHHWSAKKGNSRIINREGLRELAKGWMILVEDERYRVKYLNLMHADTTLPLFAD